MLLCYSFVSKNSRNLRTFTVCIIGPKIRSCNFFLTNLMSGSLNHSVYISLLGATSVAALLHSLSLWHCPKRVGRMWWPLSADSLLPSLQKLLAAQFEVFTIRCCKFDLSWGTVCDMCLFETEFISCSYQFTLLYTSCRSVCLNLAAPIFF